MTYTEHKITLDIHETMSSVSLSVKKGDTGRRLLIHLAARGYPYHITDDCYAVFTAKKPDGKVVFNNCRVEDCVIIYELTTQTVAAAGLVDCEIILYGASGQQLTSACFSIIVEDTIYDTDTEIESTDEYNALADLIGKTQKLLVNGPVAHAIVREADGTMISVTDASNQALQGLRIFGKSTQNGTPTPDNPVEIVNMEAPVVTVTDGTEVQTITITSTDSLRGIPVASGGNYTDSDGQQWICDEIDLGRGVYIQRIATIDLSTLSTWARGTGNGWANASAFHSSNAVPKAVSVEGYETKANLLCNRLAVEAPGRIAGKTVDHVGQGMGASLYVSIDGVVTAEDLMAYLDENKTIVQYVLAVPIETKLTDAQIAAYAALHTYKPNTTIYNDAGGYMAAEYVADTKIYIDHSSGDASGSAAAIGEVTLRAADWVGKDSPYSQVVKIEGVTECSQVDLTPSVEQLSVFYNKDLAFVTENDGGIVTVYAIGQKPENDYTIQVTITEVNV